MAEQPLFSRGDITITPTMAKFGRVTYPIANIGSVSAVDIWSPWRLAVLAAGFVAAVIVANGAYPWIALVILAATFAVMKRIPRRQRLTLATSSGDVTALTSDNPAMVDAIASAIEQAFTLRR